LQSLHSNCFPRYATLGEVTAASRANKGKNGSIRNQSEEVQAQWRATLAEATATERA
jgi:hypothetical protein